MHEEACWWWIVLDHGVVDVDDGCSWGLTLPALWFFFSGETRRLTRTSCLRGSTRTSPSESSTTQVREYSSMAMYLPVSIFCVCLSASVCAEIPLQSNVMLHTFTFVVAYLVSSRLASYRIVSSRLALFRLFIYFIFSCRISRRRVLLGGQVQPEEPGEPDGRHEGPHGQLHQRPCLGCKYIRSTISYRRGVVIE